MREFTKQQRDLVHGMISEMISRCSRENEPIGTVAKEIASLFELDDEGILSKIETHRLGFLLSQQQRLDAMVTEKSAIEGYIKVLNGEDDG